ncbi:MAG: head GIN domain-containing protein [Draconibacterium sp.]
MKARILILCLVVAGLFITSSVKAEEQVREVSMFSGISLRVSANVYLSQGKKQSIRVVAKESTLEQLITEVNGDKLIIRFPGSNIFQRNFKPGKIEIYVTVPDVNDLSVSGSGDIIAEKLEARILNLSLSGSGGIKIASLESGKLKGNISGSGSIEVRGKKIADDLNVTISGSGNFNAADFEADQVSVTIAGSGNCNVLSNGNIKARIAGSGSVFYNGNPSIDASTAGSGRVKEM